MNTKKADKQWLRMVGLSEKERAFITIGYPKISKYVRGKIDFMGLLGLKATLVDVGDVRSKEHLIGKKKRLCNWKRHFSDSQIYELTFEKIKVDKESVL